MPETVTLEITRLGAQGDGVADTASGPVYVTGALPGETVVAEMDHAHGRTTAVVQACADRVVPPCTHFGTCGGCVAQHMSDGLYRRWKLDMVRSAFAHRGLEPSIENLVAIPPGTRRRATFAAQRRGRDVVLGFHEEGSHALVDLSHCPVVLPAIERALPALRRIAEALLDAHDVEIRLAVTATPEGLDVTLLDAGTGISAARQARIAEISSAAGIIRVMSDDGIVMQSAGPRLAIGGAVVTLPPAAFFQATAEAEAAIAAVLADATRKAKRIADLFCGLGTFTFGLARRARVLAVDSDKPSLAALEMAAKAAPGIKPIDTRVRDLMREPLSRTELADFDAVVFDPPRAGAKAQVEVLGRSKVPVVCAVSCNPATLARDCRILVDAGYAIERVVPIDQFVWSPHIEVVAVLRRRL